MFKVGDRVKAIRASYGWGSVNSGDLGIVRSIDRGTIYVDFSNQNGWCATSRDLELSKTQSEFKFKRNEQVVIENGMGSVLQDGTKGTIVECKCDRKGNYYLVSARHRHRGDLVTQYIREDNLSKGFVNNHQALKLLKRD